MSAADEFANIFTTYINRSGSAELLAWLQKTDFFTAPASTKYHSCHEGGLVEHSVNVYNRFECDDPEKRAVCALLHDVCKVNFYTVSTRNVKNSDGMWEQQPFYTVDDQLPYGHGEKSVYIISGFMRLTREEAFAIRFHMGDFTDRNTSTVFRKYPLALELHIADIRATYLDEKEE